MAYIALADIFHPAVTVPFPLDPHEWAAAVAAGQQAGISVAWKIVCKTFALALLEQELDF